MVTWVEKGTIALLL